MEIWLPVQLILFSSWNHLNADFFPIFIQVVLSLHIPFTFFQITLQCWCHKHFISVQISPPPAAEARNSDSALLPQHLPHCNLSWTSFQMWINCLSLFNHIVQNQRGTLLGGIVLHIAVSCVWNPLFYCIRLVVCEASVGLFASQLEVLQSYTQMWL